LDPVGSETTPAYVATDPAVIATLTRWRAVRVALAQCLAAVLATARQMNGDDTQAAKRTWRTIDGLSPPTRTMKAIDATHPATTAIRTTTQKKVEVGRPTAGSPDGRGIWLIDSLSLVRGTGWPACAVQLSAQ
jgi:hypothetical protein